ncbi:MAG: RecQ family ATP-dependent DNA helicase, partial [Gemmatimonadota bacterium]
MRTRRRLAGVTHASVSALQVLQSTFGHDSFRAGQADIVEAVVSGRDVLAILPTGAGKSICYQIPALLATGPTLVVSPLIALMQDQVSALQHRGVVAVALTSASSSSDRRAAVASLAAHRPSLVYVAPERLAAASFRQLVSHASLSRIVVDEAHCITEWGHDFRPDYRAIGAFAESVGRPAIVAFTATATPATRIDIERQLKLRHPIRIVQSVDRPNLRWEVVRPTCSREALHQVIRAVGLRGDGAALIYVSTRALAVAVAAALRRAGHPAEAYHAGLTDSRRALVQSNFIGAPRGVIVATCAFGMGIDHPGVRLVAHFGMPGALEAYVQEAGRAGRDGLPARCLLVARRHDAVLHVKRLHALAPSGRKPARKRLTAMRGYVNERICRRAAIARWFGERAPDCQGCDL